MVGILGLRSLRVVLLLWSERARLVLWWARMVVSVGSCSIVVGIWAENGTESLLLSLREVALGVLWLTRREVVGRLTGRVGVLIVVSLALRRES